MARKSKMARAGKAAHDAWKEQQKQAAAQQEALAKARTDRLRLSEFLPPAFARSLGEEANQDMSTIEEVSNSSFTRSTYQYSGSRLAYAIWPYRLGRANLEKFEDFWLLRLAEKEAWAQKLKHDQRFDELFAAQISIERIKATLDYLAALIGMNRPGMPALPTCRKNNHFRPNQRVQHYIPIDDQFIKCHQGTFVRGTVVAATDYGTVTVRLDACVKADHTAADLEDYRVTRAVESECLLCEEEYQQLISNSFLSGEWLRLASDDQLLVKSMYEAMRKDQLRLQVGDYDYVAAVRANSKKGKM